MASEREKMEEYNLGHLADIVAARSGLAPAAEAEFLRRQTVSQEEAAASQERAAQATEQTARYTRQNARYLLASVIVLALSSILTFALSAWPLISAHR